jgi:uncharacterized RDD family membrane protein YckC
LLDIVFVIGLSYIVVYFSAGFLETLADTSKLSDEQFEMLSANPLLWQFSVLLPVAAAFVGVLYNLIEGVVGYTIGKLIIGIKIGNQDGTPASQSTLMLRYALKNIGSIFSLLSILLIVNALSTIGSILGLIVFIGCFFVLADKRQAFHDMLAKTAVFKKDALENPQQATEPELE